MKCLVKVPPILLQFTANLLNFSGLKIGVFLCLLAIQGVCALKIPFDLEADSLKATKHDVVADGNVVLFYNNYEIYADHFYYQQDSEKIILKGSVSFQSNGYFIVADQIEISNIDQQILVTNSKIKTSKNLFVYSDNILIENNVVHLSKSKITSCDQDHAHYYIESNDINYDRTSQIVQANNNLFYFYDLRLLSFPVFVQSNRDENIANQFIPEFGNNSMDGLYGNLNYGLVLNSDILGKAQVGLTQKRGIRYGTEFNTVKDQSHLFKVKAFQVEQSGFEGGIGYFWRDLLDSSQGYRLFDQFHDEQGIEDAEIFLDANYMINNINYNEFYSEMPHLEIGLRNVSSLYAGVFDVSVGGGIYEDRLNRGSKFQMAFTHKMPFQIKDIILSNQFFVKKNYYTHRFNQWERMYNTISAELNPLNTRYVVSYTKMLINKGQSIFVFDQLNEVVDDELQFLTEFNVSPIRFQINASYQLNLKQYRALKYSLFWLIHCWEIETSIDTIWQTYNAGIHLFF